MTTSPPKASPSLVADDEEHFAAMSRTLREQVADLELTDAEWAMLLRRRPSRSLTVVGDRAQARHGFPESWTERLARIGLDRVAVATLGINYRTSSEVMA